MNSLSQGIGMTSQRTRDRLVQRLRAEGIRDPRVLEALRSTPRHLFVDEALASRAYEDTALPIGYGQTISQPHTVARMTELVVEHAPSKVLEVGTGSGYQAAILARLVERVYSTERAFLALNTEAGTGQCWGDSSSGGDCSHIDFSGVTRVYSTEYAFVALNTERDTERRGGKGCGFGWWMHR